MKKLFSFIIVFYKYVLPFFIFLYCGQSLFGDGETGLENVDTSFFILKIIGIIISILYFIALNEEEYKKRHL